eukprot:TRINITY_DN32514_c0_g1_i1.p1 TRINITY_DN32514_c0_g1~~TRINITY_DN32514_c0_g1_i1.p1  ORF type:complete len:568 (+),score=165.01 TRINITY_DN32514_c0_g1_i1:108-1706(+)
MDEGTPLLGGRRRTRRSCLHRVDVGVCLCVVAMLVVVDLYTVLVPFLYESHRVDPGWVNPIADYRFDAAEKLGTPQQVLVALGGPDSIVVSWVTFDKQVEAIPQSLVTVHVDTPQGNASIPFSGTPHYFIDAPECPTVPRMMHSVTVNLTIVIHEKLGLNGQAAPAGPLPHFSDVFPSGLQYSVDHGGLSRTFTLLKVPPVSTPQPTKGTPRPPQQPGLRVAMFGDLGTMSYGKHRDASSIPLLEKLAVSGGLDMVVHIGDIAYNLDDDCGRIGDAFMVDIEQISSRIPYMVGPGNHESEKWELASYNHYLHRFNGQLVATEHSGSESVRWYSMNRDLVHFIVLDSDPWVDRLSFPVGRKQVAWLKKDFASVDRSATPWVVVLMHRAMYCTKSMDEECNQEAQSLRTGDAFLLSPPGLEDLFLANGVDLVLAGHTHHYERTYPVVRGKTMSTSYTNPRGIVHIQSGIAGSISTDGFEVPQQPWEAFRDTGFRRGFVFGEFHNASHASFTQLDANGGTVDTFLLEQHNHGAFI